MPLDLSKITFLPWEGSEYSKSTGPRLLLLGESHYGVKPNEEDYPSNFTKNIISEYICDKFPYYFFTVISKTVCCDFNRHNALHRHSFWNRIAFYNFIQDHLPASRIPPTESAWNQSLSLFTDFLNHLKPTHIIVLGKRLWYHLLSRENLSEAIRQSLTVDREIRSFRFDGGAAVASFIHHPSSPQGKRYNVNRPIVESVLRTANPFLPNSVPFLPPGETSDVLLKPVD